MKTKIKIWDSLYHQPMKKAAIIALETLTDGPPQWILANADRIDRIKRRFNVADLWLQWKNAPIN